MAAFGNSPPQGFDTTNVTSNTRYPVLIIIRSHDDYTGSPYADRRFWPSNLDYLVKEFNRVCVEIQARDTFVRRARERVTGLDYKTPSGVRPYWFKPEAPAGEPPAGLSLPRWRDYCRRRA